MVNKPQNVPTKSGPVGAVLGMLSVIPATFWPLLIMLGFTLASGGPKVLDSALYSMTVQGTLFSINVGTLFIAAARVALMLEMVKVAWTTTLGSALTDFILSLAVTGLHVGVFFGLAGFANETLFYMTLVAVIDVFAGIAIAIRVGRLVRHARIFSSILNK